MVDSLRNRLKLNSGLAETSSEELSNLSGRPAPTVSPMETSVLGGTPQQAAMAGSGAQKQNALRVAIQGQDNLQDTERTEQTRSSKTTEEQDKINKSTQLNKLGSLDARVDQIANSLLTQPKLAPVDAQLNVAAGTPPEATALINKIKMNPNDQASIASLYNMLGVDKAAQVIGADGTINADAKQKILSKFGSSTQAVSDALASSVQDKLTTGELNLTELGFNNEAELSNLLGLTPEQLNSMSIQQLTDKVNDTIKNDFSQTSKLQAKVNDTNLGATERAEARKELREMGATGVRAAENDTDKLADDLVNVNSVNFMGEKVQLDDLLDNDFVGGLVKKYTEETDETTGQPLTDWAKKFQTDEKDLVGFIDRNKNLVKQAVSQIDSGLTSFATNQQANLNIGKTAAGNISEEILKEWFPDYGKLTTEKYTPPAAINMLNDKSIPDKQKTDLITSITDLSKKSPVIAKQIKNLSATELKQAGLTDKSSPQYQALNNYVEFTNNVKNLNPQDDTQVAQALGAKDKKDLLTTIRDSQMKENSGLFGESSSNDEISKLIKAGTPLAQIGTALKQMYSPDKVNIKAFTNPATKPLDYSAEFNKTKQFNDSATSDVFDIVKPAFANNTVIDSPELVNITDTTDLAGLNKVFNSNELRAKLPGDYQNILTNAAVSKLTPEFDNLAASNTKFPSKQKLEQAININNFKDNEQDFTLYLKSLEQSKLAAKTTGDKLTELAYDKMINSFNEKLNPVRAEYNKQLADIDNYNRLSDEEKARVREREANRKKSGAITGGLIAGPWGAYIGSELAKDGGKGLGGKVSDTTKAISSNVKDKADQVVNQGKKLLGMRH